MVAGSVRLGTRRGRTEAEESAAIAASLGADELWPKLISPIHGSGAAVWPTANQGIFIRFRLAKPRTITGIIVPNGVPSGNAKAALYSSDGTTITRLALSASTALAGTNTAQLIPFTSPVAAEDLQDYLGFLALDNVTATIFRLNIGAGGIGVTLGLTYALSTTFVSPPASETIANLSSPTSGYSPSLAVY